VYDFTRSGSKLRLEVGKCPFISKASVLEAVGHFETLYVKCAEYSIKLNWQSAYSHQTRLARNAAPLLITSFGASTGLRASGEPGHTPLLVQWEDLIKVEVRQPELRSGRSFWSDQYIRSHSQKGRFWELDSRVGLRLDVKELANPYSVAAVSWGCEQIETLFLQVRFEQVVWGHCVCEHRGRESGWRVSRTVPHQHVSRMRGPAFWLLAGKLCHQGFVGKGSQ
jgi:hypothetical protein